MKRIFYVILLLTLLANFCLAKTVQVTNVKNMQIVKETVDLVNVRAPAKSKKIECEVRFNLYEGLLKTIDCGVSRVKLLNKNKMWFSDFAPAYYDEEFSFEENKDFIGLVYHSGIYRYGHIYSYYGYEGYIEKTAYVDVEFYVDIDKADILDYVKCPNTYEVRYDAAEDEAYCYKPYDCKVGKYAVDDSTCVDLPANAIRNLAEGYSCKNGFVLISSEEGDVCQKKKKCTPKQLLDEESNECVDIPENAVWKIGAKTSKDYECIEGYLLDGEGDCRKKALCQEDEYELDGFTCEKLPLNSHRSYSGWECNDGYLLDGEGDCRKKALCQEDEYEFDDFTCEKLPLNSHRTSGYYGWECNDGYVYESGSCLKKAKCGINQYKMSETKCADLPSNAHEVSGYSWKCDDGYVKDRGSCLKKAKCGINQYKMSETKCADLPSHAHKEVSGYSWKCDDGYVLTAQNFCEEIPHCSDDEVLDESLNRCEEIPRHAEKVSEKSWICKENYHEVYDDGSKCEHDPYNINSDVSFTLGGLYDFSFSTYEGKAAKAFAGEIGVEWLFGSSWLWGPTVSFEEFYGWHPNGLSYYDPVLNFGVMLASKKIEFVAKDTMYTRYFIKPTFAFSFLPSDSSEDYSYDVPIGVFGCEFGGREYLFFNNDKESPVVLDLFLALKGLQLKSDAISDGMVMSIGLRLVLF